MLSPIPQSPPPSSPWARFERVLPWVLAAGMYAFYGWYLVSAGQRPESMYADGEQRIIFLDSETGVGGAVFWAGFVLAAVAIFWVGIRALVAKRGVGWLLLIGLACCPGVGIWGLFRMKDPIRYQDIGRLRGPDGGEYRLLHRESLVISGLAIGRARREVGGGTEFRALAFSGAEPHEGYLSVVRPKRLKGENNLVLTNAGVLVGIMEENKAFLAWDTRTEKEYSDAMMPETFSPFFLIGPNDEPNESDFQALMNEKSSRLAKPEKVALDLDHPNPRVREMARELQMQLWKYPDQER